ncbi:hypothetical protein [Cryptosporangium sp. NPDC051539]|uniref:hypothetical protein n=1 Tax=Cryptosporangium sp. NPDC051539 TaxID=3363962 RepID=UPI0037A63215
MAVLNDLYAGLVGVRNETGMLYEGLIGYLQWVDESYRRLREVVSDDASDHLALGGRYRDLLAMIDLARSAAGTETWARLDKVDPSISSRELRLVNGALVDQIADQLLELEIATDALKAEKDHYARVGELPVADTNVLMEHASELAALDWGGWLTARSWGVHVVVPMQVLDELPGSLMRY